MSFHLDRVKVSPAPARPGGPPIYLGGYADAAVRRVGRIADGYVASATPEKDLHRCMGIAEAAARSVGRDPASLGLALMVDAYVSTEADPWDAIAGAVAHRHGVYDAWDEGADTPENDALEIPELDLDALRRTTHVGTPDQVAGALGPLVAPFADRSELDLIVRLHYPGADFDATTRAVELFAAEVAPALREAGRSGPRAEATST